MISKNSFWASMRENNKRRIWLWMISVLFWFFYYPVCMAMLMSRKQGHNRIDGLTGAAAKERLTNAAYEWLTYNNGAIVFAVAVIAIICAIQGFSYLYSRKKVDMYHSVPVKKSQRFVVIFMNGVLIFFVPYVLNLFLAILAAWISGGMNGHNFIAAMIAMVLELVLFLGVYGLALIAVMMTGKFIITVFAVLIFLVYELSVRLILQEYQRGFFSYYSAYSTDDTLYLSPLSWVMGVMEAVDTAGEKMGRALWSSMPSLFAALFMTAAFIGIAYFCYIKRPAEAAGKAMAFEKTKAAVKLFLTVPFSLGMVWVISNFAGSNGGFAIFGIVMAVILSNCIIEVIYEADLKAAFRKKYQILISGGCTAVIFCIFAFDLTGYDAWTPSPEKIESASFLFYDANRWGHYLDENMHYIDPADYALSKPGVTDIEAICGLSQNKANGEDGVVWLDIAYRMKDGKTVWRNFAVSAQQEDLLNRVIGSEEYKKMAYQLYDDDSFAHLREYKVDELTFSSGFRVDNLPPEDWETLREAWKKDMQNLSYTSMRDEFACGRIEIDFAVAQNGGGWSGYDIYPSFTNVLTFLKERGVNAMEPLDTENIASITVCNEHSKERDAIYKQKLAEIGEAQASLFMHSVDTSVTKTYTEKEKIDELVGALYHRELSMAWKLPGTVNGDYSVTVQYKDGQADSAVYRGSSSAYLITDRIPSWLENETAYK